MTERQTHKRESARAAGGGETNIGQSDQYIIIGTVAATLLVARQERIMDFIIDVLDAFFISARQQRIVDCIVDVLDTFFVGRSGHSMADDSRRRQAVEEHIDRLLQQEQEQEHKEKLHQQTGGGIVGSGDWEQAVGRRGRGRRSLTECANGFWINQYGDGSNASASSSSSSSPTVNGVVYPVYVVSGWAERFPYHVAHIEWCCLAHLCVVRVVVLN